MATAPAMRGAGSPAWMSWVSSSMVAKYTHRRMASIAPWLSVADATAAVDFYKAAFDAVELERLEGEPGRVEGAQPAIGRRRFWVQRETGSISPARLVLAVDDPDALFARAVAAGARAIAPVAEGHGWRVGRVVDPSGHHWEIGRPLAP